MLRKIRLGPGQACHSLGVMMLGKISILHVKCDFSSTEKRLASFDPATEVFRNSSAWCHFQRVHHGE